MGSCDNCGKMYNKYLGDRFWSGEWTQNGETYKTLCDNCHHAIARS